MAKKRANGEGTIYRLPSGSWRATLSIDGERISYTGTSHEDCLTWLRKTRERVDQGFTFKATQLSVEEYLKNWIVTKKTTLGLKTAQEYGTYILKRIIPGLGKIRLYDLRLEHIERFYSSLIQSGAGAQSIRYLHRILHSALEKAVIAGYIPRNPAHGASLPRLQQPEMRVLDESQVSQFLVTAYKTRNEPLYRLAIATGMRQGELLGLKWTDVDWKRGIINICRKVQRVTGMGFVFGDPKTRAGKRSVRVGQNVLQSLATHHAKQQEEIACAGEDWQDNGLVFSSLRGTPMDQRNLLRDFYSTLDRAGLPHIRFHDLRHTAASLLISHDTPINVVSGMLGHSKPSVTLDVYSHVYSGGQKQAASLMDELVSPVAVNLKPNLRLHTVTHEVEDG